MKISVMIGSLRKDSYHRKLFETYQMLAGEAFEFYEIPTSDFPLYNSDLTAPAIIAEHGTHLENSDAILFFSPEYNYSIPGHLKNAIDWLSRIESQPFNNKKAAIIGGSPGAIGSARMQYELRKVGVFLNLHFLNKPEIMLSSMFDKFDANGKLTDEATLAFLKKHQKALIEFIQH